MTTLHINAKIGDFSEVVLMPGDPLRAQYIANTFLSNIKKINQTRGMLAYTGSYKNQLISVMSHGIGIPSCSIYTTELITNFGVKKIIRVGTCGAVQNEIRIRDIIIAMGASTDSKVNRLRFLGHDFAAIADFEMVRHAVDAASLIDVPVYVGNVFSSDLFYSSDPNILDVLEKHGILAIEMEAAGIYFVAAEHKAHALTICTVTDHLRRGESLSSIDRQTTLNDMIKISLDSILLANRN